MTIYDTAVQTADDNQTNDGYFNDTRGIILIEAGETIAAGNIVYIHLTSGTVFVADTGTANDIRANGIALSGGAAGADIQVQIWGVYTTSGLTDKEDYYLGAAGALSTTRSGVRIGTALSTTQLLIDIRQDDQDGIGDIKSFAGSLSGVPSNSITAFWKSCDGSVLSDAESPLNGTTLPDINVTQRFLRGSATSGTTGGANSHNHTGTTGASSGGSGAGGSGTTAPPPSHTHDFTTSTDSAMPSYYEATFYVKVK